MTLSLDCGAGVHFFHAQRSATLSDTADFTVTGFTAATTCDATETAGLPAGYTKNEAACQDLDPETVGAGAEGTIVNTLNSAVINVAKDFSDDNPAAVTVSLDCGAGVNVVTHVPSATLFRSADFTVTGFTAATTCDATETAGLPAGYTKNEAAC